MALLKEHLFGALQNNFKRRGPKLGYTESQYPIATPQNSVLCFIRGGLCVGTPPTWGGLLIETWLILSRTIKSKQYHDSTLQLSGLREIRKLSGLREMQLIFLSSHKMMGWDCTLRDNPALLTAALWNDVIGIPLDCCCYWEALDVVLYVPLA